MELFKFFKSFHGYLALLACFLLVVLAIMSVVYFFNKKDLPPLFKRIGLYTLISFHIQLLVGIGMLFTNPTIAKNFTDFKIQGSQISLMEHIPANLTVVLLITIFYSRLKRVQKMSFPLMVLILVALLVLGRTFMLLHGVLGAY